MFEHSETIATRSEQDRPRSRTVRVPRVATPVEEIAKHFRSHFPILVDGVLPHGSDQGHFIRQARESLAKGRVEPGMLPAALLREVLETVKGKAKPSTKAGITPVGPRRARVWWDASAFDRVDDVLSSLDKPRRILRFYDITNLDPTAGQWNDSFDIDIDVQDKGKSVDFWAADRAYVVELGLLHADGRFVRLARTSTAMLPRESAGNADPAAVVHSTLAPRLSRFHATVVPDQRARNWIESRPDSPSRDVEAESIIHMLYRAFLLEGPRALRNAPLLSSRDAKVLEQEFAERSRRRPRTVVMVGETPALLVARIDESVAARPVLLQYPIIPAQMAIPMPFAAPVANADAFTWMDALIALARSKPAEAKSEPQPAAAPEPLSQPIAARIDLVQKADMAEDVVATLAEPVFKAAANLRNQLSKLPVTRRHPAKKPITRVDRLGMNEIKRLTKSGVRIDRMALTLEGRTRPGARLKVAGKLVRADANGRFHLECVVSGGKAPVRSRTDSGSLINVEWESKPVGA